LANVLNGVIANGNIINDTLEGKMRVDTTVGVDYGSDLQKTIDVLLTMLQVNPKILKYPSPSASVSGLADS